MDIRCANAILASLATRPTTKHRLELEFRDRWPAQTIRDAIRRMEVLDIVRLASGDRLIGLAASLAPDYAPPAPVPDEELAKIGIRTWDERSKRPPSRYTLGFSIP